MRIHKEKEQDVVTLKLSGRLDTTTAPELEHALRAVYDDAGKLVLDFAEIDYISSAGLRVLLIAQKEVAKRRSLLVLTHVSSAVMAVLEMTGFNTILKFE